MGVLWFHLKQRQPMFSNKLGSILNFTFLSLVEKIHIFCKILTKTLLIQMLFKKDTKWVQKILNEFLVKKTHHFFCKNFLQIDTNFAKMLSESCKKCSTL